MLHISKNFLVCGENKIQKFQQTTGLEVDSSNMMQNFPLSGLVN